MVSIVAMNSKSTSDNGQYSGSEQLVMMVSIVAVNSKSTSDDDQYSGSEQ